MLIRTKVVATVGPATSEPAMIERLMRAGVDVFRVNFSHGTVQQRKALLDAIRSIEAKLGTPVAVMADLCGPKIRVGAIEGGSFLLAEGSEITIVRQVVQGNARRISTTLPELIDEVRVGEKILLDDGKLRLEVLSVDPPAKFVCRVVRGGQLGSGKGVNLPDSQLKLSALTEKDRKDIRWIVGQDFDYVALSFVRSSDDVEQLRSLLRKGKCNAHIVSKIEKPQALKNIEAIIDASDAVMVARGDLGVEMDLPAVPVEQKRIAKLAQRAGKPCIIATQMLESMTTCASPTRAEVSDVANAVLDHADAVMLSGETAVGKFPVEAVTMMNQIVQAMQKCHDDGDCGDRLVFTPDRQGTALAAAAKEIIRIEDVKAVVVFTASGTTARMLAKNRLPCPVLAISQSPATVRRMCMYYGVDVAQAQAPQHTRDLLVLADKLCVARGLGAKGDKVIVISGRPIGKGGASDTLVVHTVGKRQ